MFTIDSTIKEMTAEQCIKEATEINHDVANPYTAVCSPKVGDKGA
jgi:hypothetical protein